MKIEARELPVPKTRIQREIIITLTEDEASTLYEIVNYSYAFSKDDEKDERFPSLYNRLNEMYGGKNDQNRWHVLKERLWNHFQGTAIHPRYHEEITLKMDYNAGHRLGDSLKSGQKGQYLRESDVTLVKKGIDKVCNITLTDLLKEAFPHGHPDYVPDTIEELQLHSDKNHDYSKGGDPLGNFGRVSKIMSMYPGFPYATKHGVAIVYAMKQIDAVLWSLSQGIVHKVEGIAGRLRDISVYMKLALIMLKKDSTH